MSDWEVEFGDLPPSGDRSPNGRNGKHEQIARQLRERPQEWARVATTTSTSSANSMAHQIRGAYYKAYQPKGSYEAVARTEARNHTVWARYVGTDGGAL
jgi:hypothetical protein